MRILVCIPHFFAPQARGEHGSLNQVAVRRVQALRACLTALHGHFGAETRQIQIAQRTAVPANQEHPSKLDVIICTTQGNHLLDQLELPPAAYQHFPTRADPPLLGFECHTLLREHLGRYDYYAYLEDDLLIHDSWFFLKLAWFTEQAGNHCLLQPNRYELQPGPITRAYIDGDLRPDLTTPYQNIQQHSLLDATILGHKVLFRRPLNPHSGCFFLNAEQMSSWCQQPHFWDHATSFIGPLESAATLGIMQTFRVYKPAPENADFFEIQHAGNSFINLIGSQIPLGPA
jgi:hypothetical protein